jgi:hypothetical protein
MNKKHTIKFVLNILLSFVVLSIITLFFLTSREADMSEKIYYLFFILIISIADAWLRFGRKGI